MTVSPPPPPPNPPAPSGSADHRPPASEDHLHRTSVVSEPAIGVGWTVLGSGERVNLAGPGARLGARIIDVLIVSAVPLILIFGSPGSADETSDGGGVFVAFTVAMLIATPIWCIYEVVLIAVRGQTLGKMLVKAKVVRVDSGGVPGAGKSVGRWIIPFAPGFVPGLGQLAQLLIYTWLLWDRNRQGLHDKAAGTLVIKAS